MEGGKPAGVPCVQLDAQLRCKLFGSPGRPSVCTSLRPEAAMCQSGAAEALRALAEMEAATLPSPER